MPLITDADECRQLYREAGEAGWVLPMLGTENTATTEAILLGADDYIRRNGRNVPIGLGFTSRYSGRQQLAHYTALNDAWEGFLAVRADLQRLCRADGPFGHVRVIAQLDHGLPGLDDDILEHGESVLGGIMCDASTLPFDENIAVTRSYVQRYGEVYLIEGCVDEIPAAAQGAHGDTQMPDEVARFVELTGVDLVACDLGTEHRAADSVCSYRREAARGISALIGPRLVLHGSSSLRPEERPTLGGDGVVKLNVWTLFERVGARAAVLATLESLGHQLTAEDLETLEATGVVTAEHHKRMRGQRHSVDHFADTWRRSHWIEAVRAAAAETIAICTEQGAWTSR